MRSLSCAVSMVLALDQHVCQRRPFTAGGDGSMPAGTEFCLLGPLMVRSDGVAVPVTRGKQRAVLAALLLKAGRVVSLDELAEILWGPGPPPSARVTVQNYVMRLRKALGDSDNFRVWTAARRARSATRQFLGSGSPRGAGGAVVVAG